MTKAVTEDGRLVLTVDEIGAEFRVDPVPAHRGKMMTEDFMSIATSSLTGKIITTLEQESLFIEALGASNYSRMTGLYVDLLAVSRDDEGVLVAGDPLATYNPDGVVWHIENPKSPLWYAGSRKALYAARLGTEDEEFLDVVSIREEDAQKLALCAFYWQTVVGIEAVNEFIAGGEDTIASVKALTLLRTRMSPLTSVSSRIASDPEQGGAGTPSTGRSSAVALLPVGRQSINQNPAKRKARKR